MTCRRSKAGYVAIVATAVAGAVAVPAAAGGGQPVQSGASLVQRGGRLAPPDQVSAAQQRQEKQNMDSRKQSGSDMTWADTVLVFSIVAAVVLAMTVLAVRRRAAAAKDREGLGAAVMRRFAASDARSSSRFSGRRRARGGP